jgi:hypothetical protein
VSAIVVRSLRSVRARENDPGRDGTLGERGSGSPRGRETSRSRASILGATHFGRILRPVRVDRTGSKPVTTIVLAVLAVALAAGALRLAFPPRPKMPSAAELERAHIESIIVGYNRALAEGYRRLNMSGLRQFATTDQATSEYSHMAALGEAHIRLDSQLQDIRVQQASFTGTDTAQATTVERWFYRQISIDTTKALAEDVTNYKLRYDLTLIGSDWLVGRIVAIETSEGVRPPGSTLPTNAAPFEMNKHGPVYQAPRGIKHPKAVPETGR